MEKFITAASILPFDDTMSDHKAIVVDVDLESFLEELPVEMEMMKTRGISSGDPRCVKIYRESLQKFFDESSVERLMIELKEELESRPGPLDDKMAEKVERIDKMFSEAKIEAEEKCRQANSYPWSPTFAEAKRKFDLCRAETRWSKRDMNRAIRKGIRSMTAELAEKILILQILFKKKEKEERQARRQLEQIIGDSEQLRIDHLAERAEMAEKKEDMT